MLPTKNVTYSFTIGLISRSTGQFQVNPTIAEGDFQVSTDDSAFENLDTTPAVNPSGSRAVKVTLSADEMNGDRVVVQAVDQAGDEWNDVLTTIETREITDTDLLISKRYAYNYTTIEQVTSTQKRVRIYPDDNTDGSGTPLYDFTIDDNGTTETRARGD